MRHRAELIVPIHDRRRRRRLLTLRNAGYVSAALMVLFIAISIRSEMRGRGERSYGRLVGQALPKVEQKPVPVIREEAPPPVDDQTSADPMLLPPLAREGWLHAEAVRTTPVAPAAAVPAPVAPGDDIAIVGGPEGVSIVKRERPRPVLSGGFGRPRAN